MKQPTRARMTTISGASPQTLALRTVAPTFTDMVETGIGMAGTGTGMATTITTSTRTPGIRGSWRPSGSTSF
ncbi:hypothetical protein [Breoghania sp.]|uniref:hypothetical protein n=1 Tax=Breoghania sp. TaxID=2065378 RepID=UPI002AA823BA|nr:hypothetical protein [Breoghania sp.]